MIIDDHIVFSCLVGNPPLEIREAVTGVLATGVFTTNCFYYRLCRALNDARTTGAFSGHLRNLDQETQRGIIRTVRELPPAIGITPMRDLVPIMADVSRDGTD
jgi:hypothetical protein